MAQEIEREWKNLLTKEEFIVLHQTLPFPKDGQSQINYYFETNDFQLKQHASALRIREKNGTYQLTLKQPHPEGILETHDALTKKEAMCWMDGHIIPKPAIANELNKMNIPIDSLIYYGKLTTVRYEYKEEDLIFVLDHSTYNRHEDYELEIEASYHEIGMKTFEQILTRYNITKKQTPNKIMRFFKTLTF